MIGSMSVRLTLWALHELYIETMDLNADSRMAGHGAECSLCSDEVDLNRAIPADLVLRRPQPRQRRRCRPNPPPQPCPHNFGKAELKGIATAL